MIEELRLDPRNVQAYVDGSSADLTPTEFRLLYALALEEGRVLTRDELLRVIGNGPDHDGPGPSGGSRPRGIPKGCGELSPSRL